MKWAIWTALAAVSLTPAGSAEILYDTLEIGDHYTYQGGKGDTWSGAGVFGEVYDLQIADDFNFRGNPVNPPGTLTAITVDYLSFLGSAPREGAYVALFDHYPGQDDPVQSPYAEQVYPVVKVKPFDDIVFGLAGLRLMAQVDLSFRLGRQWIVVQPKDTSPQGDFYYAILDLYTVWGRGAEAIVRDGGRANGGYGWTTWWRDWRNAYPSLSMRLKGEWVPEPSFLPLLSIAALPLLSLSSRRK